MNDFKSVIAVIAENIARFEEETGSLVLNTYDLNETVGPDVMYLAMVLDQVREQRMYDYWFNEMVAENLGDVR
ncbi:hypothetical protein OHB41_33160 [Streptomyces sp. NBC_01571]|uniref:hypothetical protein n=1 Tax=Streptomyces sp. NBC_01571 TaxID=2975883 RepID=UPI00225AA4F0|nr:hypothetical protein [Streptomyces sp. NBC_01571]MCX4577951.1 hypothetical protein [Streptomyces sp. NBC_01571]